MSEQEDSKGVSGEICDGIAYIEWKRMLSPKPCTEGPLMQCIGRHRQFKVSSLGPEFAGIFSNPQPDHANEILAKYVRSVGSTAIFFSSPDSHGRQIARAQSLGPWERKAVEVGPIEEGMVDFIQKTKSQGIEKTMIEPAEILGKRSWLVASRSADLFKSAIVPIREFLTKMRHRVPELAKESYNLASSIRIDVKFEDIDDTDDKPQP